MNSSSTSVAPPSTANAIFRKIRRFFVGAIVFVIVIAFGTVAFVMFANYGEGYRVGVIQKMAKKGVIFKTYEGELTQGFIEGAQGDPNASAVSTRIWYFTVKDDPKVLEEIDHAIETNHKVKLFYHEKYTGLPWIGDTRQIVYKVEEVQ